MAKQLEVSAAIYHRRLQRLLAEAELERDALRELAREISEPGTRRRAVDHLQRVLGIP